MSGAPPRRPDARRPLMPTSPARSAGFTRRLPVRCGASHAPSTSRADRARRAAHLLRRRSPGLFAISMSASRPPAARGFHEPAVELAVPLDQAAHRPSPTEWTTSSSARTPRSGAGAALALMDPDAVHGNSLLCYRLDELAAGPSDHHPVLRDSSTATRPLSRTLWRLADRGAVEQLRDHARRRSASSTTPTTAARVDRRDPTQPTPAVASRASREIIRQLSGGRPSCGSRLLVPVARERGGAGVA